jgi:hypothetical protein
MFETDNDWGFFVDLEKSDVPNKHKLRKIVNHKVVNKYIPEITLHTIQEGEEKVHSFDLKKIDNNDIYPAKETTPLLLRIGIMIAGITISSMLIIYKII